MWGGTLARAVKKDSPLMVDSIHADYLKDEQLIRRINERGRIFDKSQ